MSGPVRLPAVDPLTLPLRGSSIIEASAGTGKTWTIAALYLRLVLGHGDPPIRPHLPAEILVLTYTEAAAHELRDRIRARLAQAAAWFQAGGDGGPPMGQEPDPFLRALRDAYPPADWPRAARLLSLAAQSMDEATISTIHGWCARVLREHAFACGSLFRHRIEPDLGPIEREIAWDYWRLFVARLSMPWARKVAGWWGGPEDLLRSVRAALHEGDAPGDTGVSLQRLLDARETQRDAQLETLKAPWRDGADELGQWLASLGKASGLRPHDCQRWLAMLGDWARDPDARQLDLKTGWDRLSPAGLAERWRGEGHPASHPLLARLAALRSVLADLLDDRPLVLGHALQWMAARLREELAAQAQMGFQGLLTQLQQALCSTEGEGLAQRLRQAYPLLLVDEFQDTDPVQFSIFDRIYRIADDDQALGTIMIGDPKQAIYGFRGADIHAYLQVRRACAGRVYTLDRNFRSSEAMVAAVNACFEWALDHRQGAAFPAAGEPEPIAFQPVSAQGREESWVLDGQPAPALSLRWFDGPQAGRPLSAEVYTAQASAWCARRIAGLLAQADAGRAGFAQDGGFRPLRPADIAILVNSHQDAAQVRRALGRLGLRSVYLSEKESVYAAPVAQELALWLAACAAPDDGAALRAALATGLIGLGWQQLDGLFSDERAWEAMVERFHAYRQCWREQGVLPMIRRISHDFDVPARLLGAGRDGERSLTDLLHLAELLQAAAMQLEGEQALLRHLVDESLEGDPGNDAARKLRLESDEDLLRVITVHKAKGLEYPLVFLPFAARVRPLRGDGGPYALYEEGVRRRILYPDTAQLERLQAEQEAEDVRKLYVALTRARHAVWMGLAPLKGGESSAVGHVLGGEDGTLSESGLARLAAHHAGIVLDPPLETASAPAAPVPAASGLGAALRPSRPARGAPWWIASYSALHAGGGQAAAAETAEDEIRQEARQLDQPVETDEDGLPPAVAAAPGGDGGLHDFPRGGAAGTLLHGLLEWSAARRFRPQPAAARDVVARRCAVRGWTAWIEPLCNWLADTVQTGFRLPFGTAAPLRLDALETALPELEFWFPAEHVSLAALDALLCAGTLAGVPRPGLAARTLNGMLKGFIDLAVLHEGRYYVIDYKSNWLGGRDADYRLDAMRATMARSRYDLQFMLYLLALHRQLRARLPDYDYDRHMGGAVYLFLRGYRSASQGVYAERPPRALIEQLDVLFSGGPHEP